MYLAGEIKEASRRKCHINGVLPREKECPMKEEEQKRPEVSASCCCCNKHSQGSGWK